MCELFGFSARHPTRVCLSLSTLAAHGGITGPHKDGWGIAYYEGRDARIIRDTHAMCESPWQPCLEGLGLTSERILAHIRLATQGEICLANTAPFCRELGGRLHLFAHNGKLTGVESQARQPLRRYRPLGNTDSEHAFCQLLQALAPLWDESGDEPPELAARLEVIARYAEAWRPLGPANFLYSDGDVIIAHAHERTQSDGEISPPGLHLLSRHCDHDPEAWQGSGVVLEDGQEVTLVASTPLSDEPWQALAAGELVVLRGGVRIA